MGNTVTRKVLPSLGLILICALSGTSWALDAPAGEPARVEQWLEQGDFERAYAWLRAAEAEFAGSPEFDFNLGRAALGSGLVDEAYAVFERVVAVDPRHAAAWMELGRIDAARSDWDALWAKLRVLYALEPPTAARQALRQWMQALGLLPVPGADYFLALNLGYDSNANLGTALEQFAGTPITSGQAEQSGFAEMAVRSELRSIGAWSGSRRLSASLGRRHFTGEVDPQTTASVVATQSWNRPDRAWELGLNGAAYSSRVTTVLATGLQFSHQWLVSPHTSWQIHLGVSDLEYIGSAPERSRTRPSIGLGWQTGWAQRRGLLRTGVSGFTEEPHRDDSALENAGGRFNATAAWRLSPLFEAGLNAAMEYQKYSASRPIAGTRRIDRKTTGALALSWQPGPGHALRIQLGAMLQHRASSVPVLEYRRELYSLGLTWRI